MNKTIDLLKTLPPKQKLEFEPFVYERPNPNKYEIIEVGDNEFEVVGGFIDELVRGVVLNDLICMANIQHINPLVKSFDIKNLIVISLSMSKILS